MPDGILLNALILIGGLIVWELIKLFVKKGFKKVDESVSIVEFNEYKKEIDVFKKDCNDCQKKLPKEYVLKSEYREDLSKIWNKIDQLVKLYYE